MTRTRTRCGQGQAMIEMLVGLVALIALFAGLLQIASLAKVQTDTLIQARRKAADKAMDTAAMLSASDYVEEVLAGDDESPYSVDDDFTTGMWGDFVTTVVDPSADTAAGWTIIDSAPAGQFSVLHASSAPSYTLQMVRGTDAKSVTLNSAVQKLIYADDEIDVKSEVWMPWLRGVY